MGEIADVVGGGTPRTSDPSNFEDGDVSWITPADLSGYTAKYIARGARFITQKGLASSSARLVPIGTVLFTSRAPIGYVAIAANAVATNQGFKSFVLKPGVLPDYVYWWLKGAKRIAEVLASGTTFLELSGGNAKKLPIPIAPIDEQRRIVAEIEKQFSRLDEAVANLMRVKAKLTRYRAAVLNDAVGGELAVDASRWAPAILGEVAVSIRNGYSQKPDAEHGTPILRISAVRSMRLDVEDVRHLSGVPSEYQPFTLSGGDVLFTRYNGSRDYVGVCAEVPATIRQTVYPDKLIRVRVPSDMLLPGFLVIAASTGGARAFIESRIRTTAGQSGISGGDLKALPLRLPPVVEQRRIVAEVNLRLSIVREVEAEVDANLKRAQALRQAVLHSAFATTATRETMRSS